MKIWDLASKPVVGVEISASLVEAQELMMTKRVSRVIVFKGTNPEGIVTQKDLVKYLYSRLPEEDLPLIPVSGVMSNPLITIEGTKDVEDAASLMASKKISSVVVTHRDDFGIVTKTDICAYFSINGRGWFRVKEYMSKQVVTATILQSVITVAEKMNRKNISRVIVVDKAGKPIGITTLSDIALFPSTLTASGASGRRPFRRSQAEAQVLGVSMLAIGGVMTPNPITIGENADLAESASIMSKKGVGGLPVLGGNGILLGIVTKSDVVRACAE